VDGKKDSKRTWVGGWKVYDEEKPQACAPGGAANKANSATGTTTAETATSAFFVIERLIG